MLYTTAMEPSIFVPEIVVAPVVFVMVFSLGFLSIHTIKAKSIEVMLCTLDSIGDNVVVVLMARLHAGIFRNLVLEVCQQTNDFVHRSSLLDFLQWPGSSVVESFFVTP